MRVYLCLIHTHFTLRGNHSFERSEEKSYNKKYYADNKEKIADKKGLIIEKMWRRVVLTVQHEATTVT